MRAARVHLSMRARSNRVLNVMSTDEATDAQVKPEQRKSYFRADDGKANMAPPAENATWLKIVSIGLGNHEIFELGDFVGVVTSWALPGVFVGVTVDDLPKVQAAIDTGSCSEEITAKRIDVFILDPFVKTHGVSENINVVI